MAHRESVQSPELKEYLEGANFFWNISSPVGYTCRNKKEDVLLVQFFINRIIHGINTRDKEIGVVTPKPLVPDGDFGGKTWAAIKWLQGLSGACVVDGTVGEADGRKFRTPKQGKIYTIYELNAFYVYYFRPYFSDIRMDKDLPHPLINQLSGPLPDLL